MGKRVVPPERWEGGSAEVAPQKKTLCWTRIIEAVAPCFNGRFFAFGDLCVAAVHYGDFFEQMEDCAFAALRSDYDLLLPRIAMACSREGLLFERYARIRGRIALYSRVGLNIEKTETVWVNLYPLDNVPSQLTLRFKIFKEARRAMYFSSEKEALRAQQLLQRYNRLELSTCSCLCGGELQSNRLKRTVFQRTVTKEDLFPVRTFKMGKVSVPVSRCVSNWTDEPTSKRLEAISIVQRESLESLSDLDNACEKLGIRYFLVGGSLLGAVRHQGFIPWDDDTDIGLLRPDYRRFCEEVEDVLGDRYFLQTMKKEKHFNLLYARLRRSGVEYISNYNEGKLFNKGIWVDLFPFDAIPKNRWLAGKQKRWCTFFAQSAMRFKRRREYVISDMRDNSPVATVSDRIYLNMFWLLSFVFPTRLCNALYQAIARFFNPLYRNKTDVTYACFTPSYTTISSDELRMSRRVPFEELELEIPFGAEAFLSRQYGDYEVEPAPHERFANHGFKRLIIHDEVQGEE